MASFFKKDDQNRSSLQVGAIIPTSAGTAARPSLAVSNDPGTGFYKVENDLGISVGGVLSAKVTANGVMGNPFAATSVASGAPAVANTVEGVVTWTAVSVAAGATGTQVITNSLVNGSSVAMANVINWTGASPLVIYKCLCSNSTITLHLWNPDPDTASGSGTLIVYFRVVGLALI